MRTFVTADHHFGHENIIGFSDRPFVNADEMDYMMAEYWNAAVGPKDVVYHLGDFFWQAEWRAKKLNGLIALIPGNHDKAAHYARAEFVGKVTWVETKIVEVTIEGTFFVMCHYPMMSWRRKGRGAVHLHGHCHGKIPDSGMMFDVGVDVNGFVPIDIRVFAERARKAKEDWSTKIADGGDND